LATPCRWEISIRRIGNRGPIPSCPRLSRVNRRVRWF
jgi:hypothetical protein